ncbi:MAG: TolC family protein [Opitutaceae bacterium]
MPDTGVINLTMAETLRRVEEANLNVLLSKEAVLQAIEAANRERSSILPRVDLNVRQTRSKFLINQTGSGQEGSSTLNNFTAKLVGNYTIIDPTTRSIYEAAKLGITVAEYEYELALQEVLSATVRSYYTHQRNLAGMTLVEANIERAKVLLDLATDQVNAGVATQIDLTRARAQLAGEEQARLQQETLVVESGLQLKQILNLDPKVELVLAPYRMDETPSAIPPMGDPALALENRREYQQATQQLEQNKLEQRASRWQRFPSVDVFGEYGYGSFDVFDLEGEDAWLVGISLNVPIFDGLQIESNKRLADSRFRSQELVIRNLENQIRSELSFAVQDARSRLAQISVAETNKQLADEELHLARIRFEQGVADNREVIDAQNAVARANDNLVQAIYLYNIARLELARVKGEVRTILTSR